MENKIYSNEYVNIKKNGNTIYIMELAVPNKILIDSLIKTNILQGGTTTNDYKTLKFKANSVKSLETLINEYKNKNTLTIPIITNLSFSLITQLKYIIEAYSNTIIGYHPKNIIVINDNKFAFLGTEYITEIEKDMILISSPFSKNEFYNSPELLKIREIPFYVHYKTAYFSLACLLINGLLLNNNFYEEYIKYKNPKKINEYLDSHLINGTKLYWFLSRCLLEEPKDRAIVLI